MSDDEWVALRAADKRATGVILAVRAELDRATYAFPPFASAHEGYAVLREEVDELWDEIKANKLPGSHERQRREAIQVAAMAIRFVVDVSDKPEAASAAQ